MTAKLHSPRERQLCVLLCEVVIDGNGYRIKRDAVQRWIVNRLREYRPSRVHVHQTRGTLNRDAVAARSIFGWILPNL